MGPLLDPYPRGGIRTRVALARPSSLVLPSRARTLVRVEGPASCRKSTAAALDGGQRKVALSAIESPKNWFEDFGSAQLSAGVAVVALEPDFAQTANAGLEYHVFLTAREECEGLYIANATATSFEVRELHRGSSSVAFDYRIVLLRKNFENIRLEDHTYDPDPAKLLQALNKAPPAKGDANRFMPPAKPTPVMRPIAQQPVR